MHSSTRLAVLVLIVASSTGCTSANDSPETDGGPSDDCYDVCGVTGVCCTVCARGAAECEEFLGSHCQSAEPGRFPEPYWSRVRCSDTPTVCAGCSYRHCNASHECGGYQTNDDWWFPCTEVEGVAECEAARDSVREYCGCQ